MGPRNLSMKPPAKLLFFKNKQTAKKCKQTHEFLQEDTLLYKWTEIPLYFVTISLQQHLTLYLGMMNGDDINYIFTHFRHFQN